MTKIEKEVTKMSLLDKLVAGLAFGTLVMFAFKGIFTYDSAPYPTNYVFAGLLTGFLVYALLGRIIQKK